MVVVVVDALLLLDELLELLLGTLLLDELLLLLLEVGVVW